MTKKQTKTAKTSTKKKSPANDSQVEKAVEKQLEKGPHSHHELRDKLCGSESDPALGRTLQRLRRQGKLKVVKGRWVLSDSAKLCPKCQGKGWVSS